MFSCICPLWRKRGLVRVLFVLDGVKTTHALEDHDTRKKERLLLDDPDVIHSQLLTMERKLEELTSRILTIETENLQLKSELVEVKSYTNSGVVFIRWGRKDCPDLNGTQLVYKGIAGGGGYMEDGGGGSNLCLPHDPDKGHSDFPFALQHSTAVAHVWGAEYQYDYHDVKVDDDVPCAACIDIMATTTIMVPGKSSCPSGWRKQYYGHLCASEFDRKDRAEYICVDDNPQYFEGRRQNLDGKLFFPAITVCGSLPCPPYENGQYLTCAVCTK